MEFVSSAARRRRAGSARPARLSLIFGPDRPAPYPCRPVPPASPEPSGQSRSRPASSPLPLARAAVPPSCASESHWVGYCVCSSTASSPTTSVGSARLAAGAEMSVARALALGCERPARVAVRTQRVAALALQRRAEAEAAACAYLGHRRHHALRRQRPTRPHASPGPKPPHLEPSGRFRHLRPSQPLRTAASGGRGRPAAPGRPRRPPPPS